MLMKLLRRLFGRPATESEDEVAGGSIDRGAAPRAPAKPAAPPGSTQPAAAHAKPATQKDAPRPQAHGEADASAAKRQRLHRRVSSALLRTYNNLTIFGRKG